MMSEEQQFYEYVEGIYSELNGKRQKGIKNVWKDVLSNINNDLFKTLEQESTSLFKYYNEEETFISAREWENILKKEWGNNGHFPTLYKVDKIYDKREVVICFIMSMEWGIKEADAFLEKVSINDQNYNNRILYPLHFKEGFFRMIISWNEFHEDKISFSEAMKEYQKYEKEVCKIVKNKEKFIQSNMGKILEEANSKDYENAIYYCGLLNELMSKLKEWKHPFNLEQQDVLQRAIVLCFHAERSQSECMKRNFHDIKIRNKNTRMKSQRGTKQCISIINECSKKEKFSEAVECFLEKAIPVMGEAYWRVASQIMATYAKSGESIYKNSLIVPDKRISNKNKKAKQVKKVTLFEQNSKNQEMISFSIRINDIKEYIRANSANTNLLVDLIYPTKRRGEYMFCMQKSEKTYSVLCEFLSSYVDWLEGKLRQVDKERVREAMPYYRFKRILVIKYALACGVTFLEELNKYLEFSGNSDLNLNSPKEYLVDKSIKYYKDNRKLSLIGIIWNIQFFLIYFAGKCIVDEGTFEKSISSIVKKIVSECIVYPISIEAFTQKKLSQKKKELIQRYYEQILIIDILLEIIWRTVGKGDRKINDRFISFIGDKSLLWEKEDIEDVFLFKVYEPNLLAKEYIMELQEIYFEEKVNGIQDQINLFSSAIEILMSKLKEIQIPILTVIGDNSFELKNLYDKFFFVFAGIEKYYFNSITENGKNNYKFLVHDYASRCTLWVFSGGCKNFSINCYEKKYKMNNFSSLKLKKDDSLTYDSWNRWFFIINGDEITQYKKMWEEIELDVKGINACIEYLKENHLDVMQQSKELLERYQKYLKEAKQECTELRTYLQERDDNDLNGVVKQLSSCEKELGKALKIETLL